MKKQIALIGIGSGWGAPDQRTARGPEVVINYLSKKYPTIRYTLDYFHEDKHLPKDAVKPFEDYELRREHVTRAIEITELRVKKAIENNYFPIVIGGDHSLAMGTWTGVNGALKSNDFSLLWFDAHMDAHTVQTTTTMAPHGMPISILLGHGDDAWFKKTSDNWPILKPENLYQFGIRSFEDGEAELLKTLNVHIDYSHECMQQKLTPKINNVIQNLKTQKYGISIDIDAFDPSHAPGTGTVEPDGLDPNDLLSFLASISNDENCLALEIMEFNPDKDINNQTLNWITHLIEAAMGSTSL